MTIRPLKKTRGFTLVEVLIAATCLTIIIGPLFVLLRSGANTSLKGMLRIETTLKARRVLKKIYADLKMACFVIEPGVAYSFDWVMEKEGTAPDFSYQFYSFPIQESYDEIFESPDNNINYRIPMLVKYTIERNQQDPDSPFKKLIREERFRDKIKREVLTDNLNFFEIKEIILTAGGAYQHYYLITLQLVDALNSKDLENKTFTSQTNEKLRENQKDVILADFYDIVYPEYFKAIWNSNRPNPNWHTELKDMQSEYF